MTQAVGKTLMLIGGIFFLLGIVFFFGEKIPYLGKLPGDINIKKDNVQFFVPITTSVILSLIISLVLWLISHFHKR